MRSVVMSIKLTRRFHRLALSSRAISSVAAHRQLDLAPQSTSAYSSDKIPTHQRFDTRSPTRSIRSIEKQCHQSTLNCTTRFKSSLALDDSGSGPTKIIPFLLADIGEGIAEVELLQWFVEPGDRVAQFDRVCEVQSDKATVEITSRFDGVVDSLNGQVGDMISVGSPLLHVAVEDDGSDPATGAGGSSDAATASASQPASVAPTLNNIDDTEDRLHIPQVASSFPHYGHGDETTTDGQKRAEPPKGKASATPAVRKLGMEHGIDLSTILGTGPKGRVLKADILKIIKAREGPVVDNQPSSTSSSTARTSTQNSSATKSPSSQVEIIPGEDTIVPIRGYNRLMVKSMTESLQVPQMVYSDEVDMNSLKAVREDLKRIATAQDVKLSYLPFLIKAASLSITDYPVLNSSINAEDFTLTYHGDHNIGVAMDTPRGLAVPVVKHCQALSILDIAKELSRLQEAVQDGNLAEEDIAGATFTLSNIGAIGGTYMSPIVSPPQVAIGAFGKIQRLPRFVGNTDEVCTAHIMKISWGGDHRVIDGATMARFSNRWKNFLEKPMSMTFSMK